MTEPCVLLDTCSHRQHHGVVKILFHLMTVQQNKHIAWKVNLSEN